MTHFGISVPQVAFASVSPVIAAVIVDGYATLKELQTDYGCHDLYKLYEISCVTRYNQALIEQAKWQQNMKSL